MALALRYAARSDLGLGPKSRNEDSGYAGPHLLVLADGMGGHAAGDVASSMIVGHLAPLDGESIRADAAMPRLETAIREANAQLRSAMREDPDLAGMGSTAIAMLRSGNKLVMAHIGDSRAFLLREGVLTQITKDHSFVQQLLDDERITPEEAVDHPQRSLVTRVMTGQPEDEPDLSVRELKPGDRYLLCSDGLSDFVRGEVVQEILTEARTAEEAAERCIAVALKAHARDNVTVVVADVVDLDTTSAPTTVPQVVGAAAERDREGRRTRALRVSPAEKAAALTRTATRGEDADDAEDDGPRLAETSRGQRARWRALAVGLVVLVALAGAGWAGWTWTQRQLFIGPDDGYVAVYRGVSQDLGPLHLSHVAQRSDIALTDLPVHIRDLVVGRIVVADEAEATSRLGVLQAAATSCRLQAATGVPCGGLPTTTPSATPSTSTSSATRTATASPSVSATTPTPARTTP
ncbi:PP2C family protein-serine/threonine phosphatase [Lapillicoccus jejuensis]|uniref:Protein phosphatase n=1 Tax=Lapillicoccus jejuensis TaxID=402171 RepID=A0A542DYZ2_9MICO|nr:protein phosphatase 2C domain-containing protein [Lapillicoccus jejuensis]TQJ08312.1 protein phosphatase [Lapillicoccus jejuensis]